MTRADLITNIESAIGALQAAYRSGADESDLYEASLLVLCLDAARAAGGTVMLTDDGRYSVTSARFRRSPGNLWSSGFTYALVTFPGTPKALEVHLGVFVAASKSRVAHECDVAILDHTEAERSRQGAVHPRSQKLVAVIEAKHYSTSPSLGVGRAFLGLAQELGQVKCSLVFPSRSSASIAGLAARHTSEAYSELMAGNEAALRLRSRLDQAIRNWKDAI
ncbi:hypothetical protein [Amycolatopsis sp. SID8362]|uniref:hypothetical protein n=1 Tax=Amycolatopsis sp. SID8362 TaxID=2690346 RepID=UPI001369BAE9|nr:hypothetical protein [Amycolatopsis sp. SID8362]NBH12464.1 hypothetical protein [Amycolatopsis sp. SID8362]NED49156.1 hypothetical protein [Amycolatopsis sp. SID8362]